MRKDPFASVSGEVCRWLTAQPERNGRSIVDELQQHYPGQFADGQIRTLQRHIALWRATTILAFGDGWTADSAGAAAQPLPRLLRLTIDSDVVGAPSA